MKPLLIIAVLIVTTAFLSCQKEYQNNTEEITLLKEIRYNDSLLLASFKALQKQVDSLLKMTNLNTILLSKMQLTLDSVQNKLINILSQLTSVTANISEIQKQLADLLLLYQSILTQINNLKCNCDIANSLKNGLLAYYPFSGNSNDSSGNGNNGTLQGVVLTKDRFGNNNSAYKFGTNKNIIINSPSSDLNLTESFSISSWYYFDTLATTYNGSVLLSKHDGDIGFDGWVYGILNPNHNFTSQIPFFYTNSSSAPTASPGSQAIINANKWYNYIVTYDISSQSLKFFLNGQLALSTNILYSAISNTRPITIGYQKSSFGTYYDYFRGTIDEIRVYNRVLTATEINFLAQ